MKNNSKIPVALSFRTTAFGKLVRLVTGRRLLQYPDEIDHSLWKKAIQYLPHSRPTDREDFPNPMPSSVTMGDDNDTSVILVGWYGLEDPENPQNWPKLVKHMITLQLCVLNFTVYMASSIYVPGETQVMQEFGVGEVAATLGLSLYTVGYGVGPMLWSPLSEMPRIGRSSIYVYTLLAFIILQLPTGFAVNLPMLLVFRFLTGFCGSPCLATGGGTLADIYDSAYVLYTICIWSAAGVCGPVFGPLIGGYLAPAMGWQWTIWIVTIACAAVLMTTFFFLPETSAANILLNRAERMRRATGNNKLRSHSEIDVQYHSWRDTLRMLSLAFTLTFREPIVFLMDLYCGLLYGVLFLWFESFPIVFGDYYGFTAGQQGLVFLGIFTVAVVAVPLFVVWLKVAIVPRIAKPGFRPEMLLTPSFIGSFALPVCLFFYGWTSRPSIHWIVPIVGSAIFSISVVTLFNPIFNYLGMAYPRNAASVFAGNALFRASFGASFPLFGRALFNRLGTGPGNSLLGGIAVLFIPVPFLFYFYGSRIRHMSKHAQHDA